MPYIARANGEDWRWDDLSCRGGLGGRYAFELDHRSGGVIGGAADDVRIYAGDAEVAHSGFGVKVTRAFDNVND